MSDQADTRRFSFLSLLLDGDEQMFHEQLLTSDQPQHQRAAAGQLRNTNSADMVAGQALQFDRQTNSGYQYQQVAPGKFMGINSGPMIAGHLQGLQPQLQNQQESVVSNSGRMQLQAWNVENKYGLPARSNLDFIPQVYSPIPNELSPWQVGLTPWQRHGLQEQQPAVLTAKSFEMPGSQKRERHISCGHNEVVSSPPLALVLGESLRTASVTTAQVNSAGMVAKYAIHPCSKRDQPIASHTGQELSKARKIVAAGSVEVLNGKTTFRENDEWKQSALNNILRQGFLSGRTIREYYGTRRWLVVNLNPLTSSKIYAQGGSPGKKNVSLRKGWTKQSSEHLCGNTMNSSGPASIDLKMTELSLEKCKNVINDMKKMMEDEGNKIAPLLADIWNRDENSCYKNSWAGLRTLNFKNISQHLDENGYESVHDFVKEVQSMLKGVADEFVFSVEVISEARAIHDLFFEIMERTFDNIDFCSARSEVEFPTSKFNTFLLGMKPAVRHKRKRTTEWAKFMMKDKGSN